MRSWAGFLLVVIGAALGLLWWRWLRPAIGLPRTPWWLRSMDDAIDALDEDDAEPPDELAAERERRVADLRAARLRAWMLWRSLPAKERDELCREWAVDRRAVARRWTFMAAEDAAAMLRLIDRECG